MNRREFLLSAGAATLVAGCRTAGLVGRAPNLRFGVVSDIHVTTPESAQLFERSLRAFRRRGVDAVMVPGDLTDWGLRASLRYVKEAWDRVFAGTDVVPLFCTGNHDYDGWWYGDMVMEMHANGYSEADRLVKGGLDAAWEEILGEKFAPVRCRTVKGYSFVSTEWQGLDQLKGWMAANGGTLKGERPFFYFQHAPIRGTTADSFGWSDDGKAKPVLDAFPNCIAFTGHEHTPFIDERSIWQGAFTAISTPSLSYASYPGAHENGSGPRDGSSKQAMACIPSRRDLRGGQGFLVEVWDDRVVVERWDMEEEERDAADWTVPLGAAAARPYDNARRIDLEPVPQFPADAALTLSTRNTENRSGKWAIVLDCQFPTAVTPGGSRVFDYEVRVVPSDGGEPLAKRYYSPAFAYLKKREPARQRFWLDVAELPQDRAYRVEVRAFNCFGKASRPLVSAPRRGKPGLDKIDKTL